jgi:hypothetical protein
MEVVEGDLGGQNSTKTPHFSLLYITTMVGKIPVRTGDTIR